MDLETLKTAIQTLTPEDRRKLALHILELEKDHFQKNVGSQIGEDLEGFTRAIQEAAQRVKQTIQDALR